MKAYLCQKTIQILVLFVQAFACCLFIGGIIMTLVQLDRHEDKLQKLSIRVERIAHGLHQAPEKPIVAPRSIIPKATYF